MIILLLLLAAPVSLGKFVQINYGETISIDMPWRTQYIEFTSASSDETKTLWDRDASPDRADRRLVIRGSTVLLHHATSKDSGHYRMISKYWTVIETLEVEVNAKEIILKRAPGEDISFNIELDPNSCNIYFIRNGYSVTALVLEGVLQYSYDEHNCGFELFSQCGISYFNVQSSCQGNFEIRDQDKEFALIVSLEIEERPPLNKTYLGLGISFVISLLSCCCCTLRACCKKSSSSSEEEKEMSESPDAEPVLLYHREYDQEPAGSRQEDSRQPSETVYPALPSYTQTGPQINNPPSVNVPPAHSTVSALADDNPTVPLTSSDPEPRFELSFPSDLPLSSTTTATDVYMSDKLNF